MLAFRPHPIWSLIQSLFDSFIKGFSIKADETEVKNLVG